MVKGGGLVKAAIEDYFVQMLEEAREYCKANHLNASKIPDAFWCWNQSAAMIVHQNPKDQPELGMGDDANLPFPILIVHFEQQPDGKPRCWCEETEFTRIYLT